MWFKESRNTLKAKTRFAKGFYVHDKMHKRACREREFLLSSRDVKYDLCDNVRERTCGILEEITLRSRSTHKLVF